MESSPESVIDFEKARILGIISGCFERNYKNDLELLTVCCVVGM
jgi:hypothetical protein